MIGRVKYGDSIISCYVARFLRKSNLGRGFTTSHRLSAGFPNNNKPLMDRFTSNQRSFVDVFKGFNLSLTHHAPPCENVIHIREWVEKNEFFAKEALMGEVQSLENLRNLTRIFKVDGVLGMKIFYLGGMLVMLNCESSVRANDFLSEKKKICG